MFDLSDWAWLIVVGVWFLVKAVASALRAWSRRRSSSSEPPTEPKPARFGDGGSRGGAEFGPGPIEPR